MFYSHFYAHGRLNRPSDLQRQWSKVRDETPFRYAHAEIQTQVVFICRQISYQLDPIKTELTITEIYVFSNIMIYKSKIEKIKNQLKLSEMENTCLQVWKWWEKKKGNAFLRILSKEKQIHFFELPNQILQVNGFDWLYCNSNYWICKKLSIKFKSLVDWSLG